MNAIYSGKWIVFRYDVNKEYFTATVSGIDLGATAVVHDVSRNRVVLKVPGHKVWAGLGMEQEYYPASFVVFDLEPEPELVLDKSYPTRAKISALVCEFPARRAKA